MPENLERILEGCFHPKEGRPNLQKVLLSADRAQQYIDKAHSNLRAMKLMFDSDLFDWTIICGYYAMYHAVLAALYKIGIRATAHYCALAAFKEFYVKRGKVKPEYVTYIKRAKQLEQKYSESLNKAQENRVVEQYGVEIITNDDAEWIIEDAKDFVLKIEEVLAS
ncbi:MAG: HEPN domain-containing protein [Candidatus Omnitrophica bacterium]|nr:HEPN domain-containing protein [Candidatus Omnitrophota bacterium]MBU4479541.1 HEPN domain-containing protein [Candidatus Omnitrophota bacterium]